MRNARQAREAAGARTGSAAEDVEPSVALGKAWLDPRARRSPDGPDAVRRRVPREAVRVVHVAPRTHAGLDQRQGGRRAAATEEACGAGDPDFVGVVDRHAVGAVEAGGGRADADGAPAGAVQELRRRRDAAHVPATDVLVEARGVEKHLVHVGHLWKGAREQGKLR
eukprot:3489273-Rhodomonas_salina.5